MMKTGTQARAMFSWLFLATLLILCAVLGALQYRWIDEVSAAARDRLRGSLQASLFRVDYDLNAEIAAATRSLAPRLPETGAQSAVPSLISQCQALAETGRPSRMFRRIGIAQRLNRNLLLSMLDLEHCTLHASAWPPEWTAFEQSLHFGPGPRGDFPQGPPPSEGNQGSVFAIPLLPGSPPRGRGAAFRDEISWMVFELNLDYLRQSVLPEIIQRHLGAGGGLDYQVEVVTRSTPPAVVYQSDPGVSPDITTHADASIDLLNMPFEFHIRGRAIRGPALQPGLGPGGPPPNPGRWQMFVRHRTGSLEALVAQTRRRNLAVTGGVLLLMMATIAALIRFTRRAQALAAAQMDFVAGISHELRTPLTVINTAGYNLQGKMAANPAQVARYGALIQRESSRLRELVEQVLTFRGAEAGHVIQNLEPVSVETVIEAAVESSRIPVEASKCLLEKNVAPGLPAVMGDARALTHVLENLLGNAAKYGSRGGNWIGVSASKIGDGNRAEVEIRVSDRGPGIPESEQKRIFEPFFRGARAVAGQVHGTGLGLSLVKKIVEAHGGTIQVKSAPMHGAEFIVRIPAAPAGAPE